MTIREAILKIVEPLMLPTLRTGVATNIDTTNCICDVQLDDAGELFIYACRFKSIQSNDSTGVVAIPKDGSIVTAAMNEGVEADWVIVKCNEVDSWAVFTSGGKLQVNKDGTVWLNGSTVGGQDSPLVEINALKTRLNLLESLMSNHQHTAPTGGGPTTTNGSQTATQTAVADISNTKVSQGDGN